MFCLEDGVNEATGLMSTKLSCCYKIDGCRDAEERFSIAGGSLWIIWFSIQKHVDEMTENDANKAFKLTN